MNVIYETEAVLEPIDLFEIIPATTTKVPFIIREPQPSIIDMLDITQGQSYPMQFCNVYNGFKAMNFIMRDELNTLVDHGYDYTFVNGSPCRSLITMEGSQIVSEPHGDGQNYVRNGHIVELKVVEKIIDAADRQQCCIKQNSNCPYTLNNEYVTEDCDVHMRSYCDANPDALQCITWMSSMRESVLDIYAHKCSIDLNAEYCTVYMSNLRSDPFLSGDSILDIYCKANLTDPNCNCYMPPESIRNSKLVVDAPYECWYDACVGRLVDDKWLSDEQRKSRKGCKYLDCILNIGSISSDNIVSIENLCKNAREFNYVKEKTILEQLEEDTDSIKMIGFNMNLPMFVFVVFIAFVCLLLFLKSQQFGRKPLIKENVVSRPISLKLLFD